MSSTEAPHTGEDEARQLDRLYADVLERHLLITKADSSPNSLVARHLARALRIRQALQNAERELLGMRAVVDRLPFGVAFLDGSGRLIFLSEIAEGILRDANGLIREHDHVRAVGPSDDRLLRQNIRAALGPRPPRTPNEDPIFVRRTRGLRPLLVAVVRTPERRFALVPSVCMLLIFDPETKAQPSPAVVAEALALTSAEARLASALFTGATLREAAATLGVSVNTCKSQLKSIYAKTGCSTHVGLAMALFNIALFS